MALLRYTEYEEDITCTVCQRLIPHEQWKAQSPKGRYVFYFIPIPHVGMCGLPCMGGGVHTEKIRPGDYHDNNCTSCRERAERI